MGEARRAFREQVLTRPRDFRPPVKLEGEYATIVQHCSVVGILRTETRAFNVREPAPYAQHATSVLVSFVKPRKRTWAHIIVVPDDSRFLTIERDGVTLYDSRTDVPVDMEKWTARYQQSKAESLAAQAEADERAAKTPGVRIDTGAKRFE